MSQINNTNKEGKIVLLIVMLFVILAVVTIALVVTERNSLRFLSPNQSSISEKDKIVSHVSEAEKKEISEGLRRTIAGKVVSVDKDQRSIVIDEDPFGAHKETKISTTNKTKVSIIYESEGADEQVAQEQEGEEQLSFGEEEMTEKSETDFDFVETGKMVEVYFAQRMDVENSSELVAQEIVILPN
jgi:cytoskeletal protein RodZ